MKQQIILDAQAIAYELRQNKRSKYIKLSISQGQGLVVTVPPGTTLKNIEQAIYSKKAWILRHLAEAEQEQILTPANPAKPFKVGDTLSLMGEEYPLEIEIRQGNKFFLQFANQQFKIEHPAGLEYEALQSGISQVVKAWYTQQAKTTIPQTVKYWAEKMDLKFNRISIRDQRSRWGSCSQLGNLNFNWRLLMVPTPILDYVIVHELAHLVELNHSRAFWQIVESFCPDYKQRKKWLAAHGQRLFYF